MSLRYSSCFSFSSPNIRSVSTSENPMMAFSGVRSSWDMLARNSDLCWPAVGSRHWGPPAGGHVRLALLELDSANGLRSRGHDDVHGQCDELRRDPRELLGFALAPPRFDQDVLALEPAQFAQPFPECAELRSSRRTHRR